MTEEEVLLFFSNLSHILDQPATVILTGGTAALLMGGVRPTVDIDFAIDTQNSTEVLEAGIKRSATESAVVAQFSQDIDRWSSITLLDYKRHTRPYKKFNKIEVRILDPEYWSIGKMSRYYDSDISDMIAVFRAQKTDLNRLLSILAKALVQSPPSTAVFQFKKQVEHFLSHHGKTAWGNHLDIDQTLQRWTSLVTKKKKQD